MTTVLLLAGTHEARALAAELANRPGLRPIASYAGATVAPQNLGVPTRTGGFGGVAGLIRWLQRHAPVVLIDATHPFAAQMQAHAAAAATHLHAPRLRLLRVPWPRRAGWHSVATLQAAADALPSGARALITTGRKDLAPFAARTDTHLFLRSIDDAGPLPAHIQPIRARPPFTLDAERALFALLGVTHLVSKNAGGAGTAKIDAADALGLRTIMVDRPAEPPGPIARSVPEALAWLNTQQGTQ